MDMFRIWEKKTTKNDWNARISIEVLVAGFQIGNVSPFNLVLQENVDDTAIN